MVALQTLRQFYAALMTASVGVTDPRVIKAFATVPREQFLGPGPWQVVVENGYMTTPSDDPELLYQDIVVALSPSRKINNGEPSLHARMLAAVAPQPGERALQIGTGTGYYTALLAELVGESGTVLGIEIDPELADWTCRNLADRSNVTIGCRSGVEPPLPESDVIYVCAGATEPMRVWLEALSPAGRLLFPLTPGTSYGAILRIAPTSTPNLFEARFVTRAGFIPCVGAQSPEALDGLKTAFARGGTEEVRSLHCGPEPDATCWYAGEGWWLSKRPVASSR
ncbi:MAG: protein-L-isoaspartate(D-aspartate) O-methyltransferase [Hyphomicrobiaceae bacterium]